MSIEIVERKRYIDLRSSEGSQFVGLQLQFEVEWFRSTGDRNVKISLDVQTRQIINHLDAQLDGSCLHAIEFDLDA